MYRLSAPRRRDRDQPGLSSLAEARVRGARHVGRTRSAPRPAGPRPANGKCYLTLRSYLSLPLQIPIYRCVSRFSPELIPAFNAPTTVNSPADLASGKRGKRQAAGWAIRSHGTGLTWDKGGSVLCTWQAPGTTVDPSHPTKAWGYDIKQSRPSHFLC